MSDYAAFVRDLQDRFGPDAAAIRHELYFQSKQPFPGARAVAALVRDMGLLRRGGGAGLHGDRLGVLVTSLAGTSGWGTLERAVDQIRHAGLDPVILAHPRLPESMFPKALPLIRPGRPDAVDMVKAAASVAGGAVSATLARRLLWQRALARALDGASGVLVLHNDFDMMSAAACGLGWPTLCLQHGIPTDEFFPIRADRQVVWGASSARAYEAGGCPAERLVQDALGRAMPAESADLHAPDGIALLSQGHAIIFGDGLRAALRRFAAQLGRSAPGSRILLHPQEKTGRLYDGIAGIALCRPPHAVLAGAGDWRPLVIGYCSTAMIDAAMAGHWVAGLDLPLSGNQSARMVATPPLMVPDAAAAIELCNRLAADPSFRADSLARQRRWLQDILNSTGGSLARVLCEMVSK